MKKSLLLFSIFLTSHAFAYDLNINAKAAYLYHPQTGKVLHAHNANVMHGPASLTKLMTLTLLFDAIADERLTLETELPISEKAWRKGGSKMFLEVGKTVKVEDLIRGIAISSGNDATIVVAEYLAGTEDAFAAQMNQKAIALNMENTNFMNASGWPDPKQYTTAEDMVKLAAYVQKTFPQFAPYFQETSFAYSEIRQSNRNGLLKQNSPANPMRVTGMKTGHTEDSGYHLLATAEEGGQQLISIALGTDGFAARENENLKLLRFGFTQHEEVELWNANADVITLPVWLGTAPNVDIITASSAKTFANKRLQKPENIKISYTTPLVAPLQAGQQVGEIQTEFDGQTFTTPLLVSRNIEKTNTLGAAMQRLFHRLGLE